MPSRERIAWCPIVGLLVACSQPEPGGGHAAHPTATTPASSEPPAPLALSSASSTELEPAAPSPAASEPSPHELCDRVCKQIAGKCAATVAESCRLNCDRYDQTAPACEKVARDALTCAEAAKDLPCANLAPESCNKAFQRLAACQQAPESFADAAEASAPSKTDPSGWVRFEPEGEGFVATMPPGAQKATGIDEKSWSVHSDNVDYFVRKLQPPAEKLTPKSQVRLAMQWLTPCDLKLKLHGQIETDEHTSLHYDVGCKSGTERHGIFYITRKALFVVGVEGPPGERGKFDAFVYGFSAR